MNKLPQDVEDVCETLLQENYYEQLDLLHKIDFVEEVQIIRQAFSELQDNVENNLGLFKHMQHISQGHLDKLNRIREIVEGENPMSYRLAKIKEVLDNVEPQPLTELRDEIIAELEEQTLQKWKYKEYNFPLCEFKTDEVLEGFYSKGYCEITTSNGDVHWDSISLSGELAHKITTYFMRLKEENND